MSTLNELHEIRVSSVVESKQETCENFRKGEEDSPNINPTSVIYRDGHPLMMLFSNQPDQLRINTGAFLAAMSADGVTVTMDASVYIGQPGELELPSGYDSIGDMVKAGVPGATDALKIVTIGRDGTVLATSVPYIEDGGTIAFEDRMELGHNSDDRDGWYLDGELMESLRKGFTLPTFADALQTEDSLKHEQEFVEMWMAASGFDEDDQDAYRTILDMKMLASAMREAESLGLAYFASPSVNEREDLIQLVSNCMEILAQDTNGSYEHFEAGSDD